MRNLKFVINFYFQKILKLIYDQLIVHLYKLPVIMMILINILKFNFMQQIIYILIEKCPLIYIVNIICKIYNFNIIILKRFNPTRYDNLHCIYYNVNII